MTETTAQRCKISNWLAGFSLNRQAHDRLESFLREHLQQPDLKLPAVKIYSGRLVALFARLFQFGAITINRRIFVRPDLLFRDGEGQLTMEGWLLAHEALHVCQYVERGRVKFLYAYLKEYFASLWRLKKINAATRLIAYLSIDAEVAAREAEKAYQLWTGNKLK